MRNPFHAPSSRRAIPFAVLLFLLVAAHGLLETARDGLFLTEQPVDRLPWLYLAVAAGVLVLTPLQRRLWDSRGRIALPLTLVAAAAVTLVFWAMAGRHLTVLAFYVWTALFSSLVFVQFWLTADEAFGVEEAKRAFGFIAAGGLVGAVTGSATARIALDWTGPRALLLFSGGLTVAGAALGILSARVSCAGPAAEVEMPVTRAMPGYVKRDAYLRLLAILALLTAASATLIDYLFKAGIANGMDPERIPRMVANVYLGQSALALLVELVLVGMLLRTTGVTRSLALLPLVVLAGAMGYAVGAGLVVLLGLKILDGGLRPSVYRVGSELLFLPVGSAERRVVKPSIDTLGQRSGQALASIFLLGVPMLPAHLQMGVVTIGLAVVGLGWVQATRVLRRHYLRRFQEQLGAGRVTARSIEGLDLASAEVLVAALGSSSSREVLTALDVLAGSERLGIVPALILYHPDPAVVRSALRHFSAARRPDVDALLPFLLGHSDELVRAAAAERWLRAGRPPEGLRAATQDWSPKVSATALVALSALEGEDDARRTLDRIAHEGETDTGRALAWAIANAPRADLLPVVEALFERGDVETRRELLRSAQGLPAAPPEFIIRLLDLLKEPALRSGARDALVFAGPRALVEMERRLLEPDTPFRVARELPATIARFSPGDAARPLLKRLTQPRGGLDRFRSLRALNQLRRDNPRIALDEKQLQAALEIEIASAFRNRTLRLAGGRLGIAKEDSDAAGRLLVDLLRDRERRAIERVFRVLDLLHQGSGLEQVYLGLRSDEPRRRDAAREVLVELLSPRWREVVLVLLDPDLVLPGAADGLLDSGANPETFVAALLDQSSEVVRLLTPCLARERRWTGVVPRLRAGPRCADDEAAAVAAGAIQQLEREAGQVHA
jgi:AAA family ATP:ADP antiporter